MKTTGAHDGPPNADRFLVGREADIERLGAFLTSIPRTGGSLLILGEPGVGKSALLAAAVREAEGTGIRVLQTVGVQYRAQVPFGILQQLLASTPESQSAAAGLPALAVALGLERGTAPGHEAVADAMVNMLTDRLRDVPTLLVLDDVQWSDRASAVVLRQLAHRLLGGGVGMLCAARPGDGTFLDYSGLPLHELGPLNDTASEALLTRRFPALAPRVRHRLMADAEGNPLALLELPAALTDSQRAASQALPKRLPLTQRLQSAFASRIKSLPAATRHLLLVAALEGSGNMHVVRRATAGRCDLKHLAPAERAQLVAVDEATGRLGFRHSLTRSAVVELSTSDQRRNVHRALAEAWIAVPEQRAWHLAQATVGPDEQIAALLEEVADASARRGDGPNAVTSLLRAADLSPAASEQARRLARAAYQGANVTGDLREVPRLLDDARYAAPDGDSPAAAVAAAMYLLNNSGDIDTAHRLLCHAIARRPQPYDLTDATLLEAMSTLLLVCVYGGRRELWAHCDEVLSKCVSVPDTLRLLRTTFADPARALPSDWALLDTAVAGLPGTSDPIRIVRIATAAAYADRLGAIDEPLRHTARGGRTGKNNFPAIQASFLWGSHAWFTGRWPELRDVVGNGLSLCDELNYPLRAFTGRFVLGCVSAACGDYPSARDFADQMDHWAASRRADAIRCYAAHVRTLIALSRGDFEDAHRHACRISPTGSMAPFVGHALWSVLDQVEAAVRSGRREQARDHVEAARDAGLDAVSPRLRMVLLASAALAAERDEDSFAGFGEAVTVGGAERWPFDHARIQLCFGERLRRGKAPAQARHHLSAAAETFGRLGAVPWHARAGKELRACGGPVPVPLGSGAADMPLTPQQWEIASLAAAGLTNRQIGERLFLSPRTVSTHLYQVFPKLGITSRAALRDALEPLAQQ